MPYEELLSLVKSWLEEEVSYARELSELASNLRHPVLRALFLAIAKDSEKHNLILSAMRDYIEEKRPLITQDDLEKIKERIKEHIEEESKAIQDLTRLKEKVDDPALLLLIEAMLEDEIKHHALLVQIQKLIAEKEAVSDQELWEALWLHSPYHGTPGG